MKDRDTCFKDFNTRGSTVLKYYRIPQRISRHGLWNGGKSLPVQCCHASLEAASTEVSDSPGPEPMHSGKDFGPFYNFRLPIVFTNVAPCSLDLRPMTLHADVKCESRADPTWILRNPSSAIQSNGAYMNELLVCSEWKELCVQPHKGPKLPEPPPFTTEDKSLDWEHFTHNNTEQ